jgi:hypothetical protein
MLKYFISNKRDVYEMFKLKWSGMNIINKNNSAISNFTYVI